MKYEKEIKQLKTERDQVKVQIDNLIIDYNGIQKAIKIFEEMSKSKEEKNG